MRSAINCFYQRSLQIQLPPIAALHSTTGPNFDLSHPSDTECGNSLQMIDATVQEWPQFVLVDFSLQCCTHPTPLPASRYDLFCRALRSQTTLLRARLWTTGISAATVHLRAPTNVSRCCWSCRSMIGMGLPSISMRSIQSDWSENICLQVDQQNTTTAGAARRQHGLGGFLVG